MITLHKTLYDNINNNDDNNITRDTDRALKEDYDLQHYGSLPSRDECIPEWVVS